MPLKPTVGAPGGQQYPVLKSIQKILQNMTEGGAVAAATVIKEILQNADDAGASELTVILDERSAPTHLPTEYAELFGPALLVRNNVRFYLCETCRSDGKEEYCEHDKRDDFHAIRDVASGHKEGQATATGRFGIGFNSVYFLTDTPLLFSRREVHIFDLLHKIVDENGWKFTLDEFPARVTTHVGALKAVLEWCLPKAALADRSFADLALDREGDYQQTLFRLPLRWSRSGTPAIYDDRFPDLSDRRRVLSEMIEESARSILFLKHITTICFSILWDREPEPIARVTATPPPPEFKSFQQKVQDLDRCESAAPRQDCRFLRKVECRHFEATNGESSTTWNFHVLHSVRFDDDCLHKLRERLRLNDERAVPWASVAVPLDVGACHLDGRESALWRVSLPLLEEGPSNCVFSASMFVGPSRQRVEYRLDVGDDGRRRTDWNKALVEHALIPLLKDLSAELPVLARNLLENHPREYLSLFPRIGDEAAETETAEGLTAFFRQRFCEGMWFLRLPDIWGESIDIYVGDDGLTSIEMIPDWLIQYGDRFRMLSTEKRRFLRYALGDALAARVGRPLTRKILRQPVLDVVLCVLRHQDPPKPRDLANLIQLVAKSKLPMDEWEGVWAFASSDGQLLRYSVETLYLLQREQARAHSVVSALHELPLSFESVAWVMPDTGLASFIADLRPAPENIIEPDAHAAFELLRRLPEENAHDQDVPLHVVQAVVDFLVNEAFTRFPHDARLGFLIRTAHQKHNRRALSLILLKPLTATASDRTIWEVWFRRLFAEVDPSFAREVHRLLSTHPGCLEMLHARDCTVAVGSTFNALDILHSVRLCAPEIYDRLEAEINREGAQEDDSVRVASALLELADTRWDRLKEDELYTVLALPIHRRPDGKFIRLVAARDGEVSSVASAFRLQCDEDIDDAPITLSACQLLQTPNPVVRRFYRQRLGLNDHGRVAVLKDVLRQIGEAADTLNASMLQYLASYYEETLRRLEASRDETDESDARELRQLFAVARTVPCLDGVWRAASECVSAWRVAERLEKQHWPKNRLAWLVAQVYYGQHIVSLDESTCCHIERLHRIREVDPRSIAELAITSQSDALSLADRVKLLTDNWRDRPDVNISPSTTVKQLSAPVLCGRALLAEAELLDERHSSLPSGVLRQLTPTAVNTNAFEKEGSCPRERVHDVLRLFGVPPCTSQDIDSRLVEQFHNIWPDLRHEDRIELLRYLGERDLASELRTIAFGLDTVLVATRPHQWHEPRQVLTPNWAATKPPHLAVGSQPLLTNNPQMVLDVWNQWCGIQCFADLLPLVLAGAAQKADQRGAARETYQWLKRVVPPQGKEVWAPLREQRWVLAQRGEVLRSCRPSEVIMHPAEPVLIARFWVPVEQLPEFAKTEREELGFQAAPPTTFESLRDVAECLSERATAPVTAAVNAYTLVEQLLEESELHTDWKRLTEFLPVYRTFRSDGRQLTGLQLFIGDRDYGEDLSSGLACLRSNSALPKGVIKCYRALGVTDSPTLEQVLGALAGFEAAAESNVGAAYSRLVRAVEQLAKSPDVSIDNVQLGDVRVLSCAGTFEPISGCYLDEEFGRRRRVSATCASRLVDTTDRNTQRLLEWINWRQPGTLVALRAIAQVEIGVDPQEADLTPKMSYLFLPWRQWAREVVREGSALADQLSKLGLTPRCEPLQIVPVNHIHARFHLDDGTVIEQSDGWAGPPALGDAGGRVFVRQPTSRTESRIDASKVSEIDMAIAREVAILLGGTEVFSKLKVCVDEIVAKLERPSTVLRRLREAYREHFRHQYHDQVADPHFAEIFDEYQRTVRSSKRAAELEEQMDVVLTEGFVLARREQIRGYGYDEFSVFAELLQNAEDAYIQRSRLGMDMPAVCGIVYRYSGGSGEAKLLDVEHCGRPFNYWQHGSHQDRNLSRDVEGVLRSAGSFKPHAVSPETAQPETRTIGRFGLGFKSVYLLTDRPEIHSGSWHFAIEAGCLPKEELPPFDLDEAVTRIRLPLRPDIEVLSDTSRLLNLLPFLGMIRRLEFQIDNAEAAAFAVNTEYAIEVGSMLVEHVTISGPDILPDGNLKFIRCRSRDHAGQLALLLARDGSPARWDEVFDYDLFAVLPLRAELRCGVAASHHFEVQSGRTHLVDPKANSQRFAEITALLEGIAEGLRAWTSSNTPLPSLLSQFWAMWRWEQGDTECEPLRREFAKTLVALAERVSVVPTLDPKSPTCLAEGPRFFFSELPDSFREAIIATSIVIPVAGLPDSPLSSNNVVAEGFASAYRRACEYAGIRRAQTLIGIGWNEIAKACRERAWLAEKPELLSKLAESLNEEQSLKAAAWVALCPVVGEDGAGHVIHILPGELLPPEFPGYEHLPKRFLRRVSAEYNCAAMELLSKAGLRAQPTSDDFLEWLLAKDITTAESIGILRYLADDDRFRDFWDLRSIFRTQWFPRKGRRLSTTEAVDQGLIPKDILEDDVFRTWIGLGEGQEMPEPETAPPTRDTGDVLEDLFAWWQIHGASWVTKYEERLYPKGHPPTIRDSFSSRDRSERKQWMTLLLLGAFHTMGRTRPEQHRDFLRRCEIKGWLDIFADKDQDAQRWMDMLSDYLDEPDAALDYYQWIKQFVVIFQLSRSLPEYVESFLNINRVKEPFALDQVLSSKTSALFSGGGPYAPTLMQPLGMGASFVMRELVRLDLLRQPLAHRFCYVPSRRVCAILEHLGCPNLAALRQPDRSPEIHRFLTEHLGTERATFHCSFDLPLLAMAENKELQEELLGYALPSGEGSAATRVDEGWRTLSDGRRVNIYG